jgi:hypothetical protein
VVASLLRVPHEISLVDGEEPGRRIPPLMASMAVAVAAIAVLNLADILTTRMVLAHTSGVEANPVASALLAGGRVGLLKAGVLLALIYRVPRRRPTVAFHAVLWFVAGFYFLTVVSNLLVLHQVS